jgi:hypothetical protein
LLTAESHGAGLRTGGVCRLGTKRTPEPGCKATTNTRRPSRRHTGVNSTGIPVELERSSRASLNRQPCTTLNKTEPAARRSKV